MNMANKIMHSFGRMSWTIVHGPKGKFESYGISETEKVTTTKIGVHAYYINTYLHEFFEPIPIN